MFEAFRERDYRAFWLTQFLSNIGWWMQVVAQGWLVYRLSDSAFLLGFVAFASTAPALVLMLPGGVLADQLDRKRVVIVSQWAQAASAFWLAVSIWLGKIDVWQIIGAATVVGIAQSFSAPAWQAMVVDLLDDRKNLPNAVAMNSLQFNSSRAFGPFLAGFALSAWGPAWCFLANAISFVPLIFVLGSVRNRQEVAETGPMLMRLREGFLYVRQDRIAMLLLTVVAATTLFGAPFINLMPVVARALFVDDASGNAWLMGATGAGTLTGALALSIRTPGHKLHIIGASLLLFGLSLSAVAFVDRVSLVMAAMAVAGLTMVLSMALCNTTIQQRIPDGMRGRVLSMYTFAFFAFAPVGNLVAGAVAERRGIDAAMLMMGLGLVVCAVAMGIVLAVGGRRSAVGGGRAAVVEPDR